MTDMGKISVKYQIFNEIFKWFIVNLIKLLVKWFKIEELMAFVAVTGDIWRILSQF